MTIFVLEDNPYKLSDILEVLSGNKVVTEKTFNAGVRKLLSEGPWDLVILDNTVPRYEDSMTDIVTRAAELVLQYMFLEDLEYPTVICSSDPVSVSKEHVNLLGSIQYSPSNSEWRNKLLEYVRH